MLNNLKTRLRGKSGMYFFRAAVWFIAGVVLVTIGSLDRRLLIGVLLALVMVLGYLVCGIAAKVLEKQPDDESE